MITGVVIGLLLLGILLILVEILFVPGTTIVGIGGVILLGIGVYMAYAMISTQAGHLSLAGSVVLVFLSLIVLLKGQTWKRMALDTKVEGKGVENIASLVAVGDRGRAISRLNPMGKALINDQLVEVATAGEFVDSEQEVEVVKVEQNKINVKPV